MSDTVTIVAVITLAVVAVLFMLRKRLSRFVLTANREGLATEIETNSQKRDGNVSPRQAQRSPKSGIKVRRNIQYGTGNTVDIQREGVALEGNEQMGDNNSISVGKAPTKAK